MQTPTFSMMSQTRSMLLMSNNIWQLRSAMLDYPTPILVNGSQTQGARRDATSSVSVKNGLLGNVAIGAHDARPQRTSPLLTRRRCSRRRHGLDQLAGEHDR